MTGRSEDELDDSGIDRRDSCTYFSSDETLGNLRGRGVEERRVEGKEDELSARLPNVNWNAPERPRREGQH